MNVLVFIFPNCMGGVSSFNRNLINHTSLKGECKVRVVFLEAMEDKRAKFEDPISAHETIHFAYSHRDNQHTVCRRLYEAIGNEPGCVIADNTLTLNAVGLFGCSKRMIYLVHDYFYVNGALSYHKIIDAVVAHSSFFCDVLLAAAVTEYQGKTFHIPYGVELPPDDFEKPKNSELKLVFLGRLVEEKGVLLLKEIDNEIQRRGLKVQWTILGKGPLGEMLREQWNGSANVSFIQANDTAEVYAILQTQDVLVFPSWFEGTPVSIMECISRGVVPVVSDLPGGTRDMVTPETGMRCPVKDVTAYVNAIEELHGNRQTLQQMQSTCIRIAREKFDIVAAADAYFSFFLQQARETVLKKSGKVASFSSLDRGFIPNWMVYQLRTLRQYLTTGRS